MVYTVSLRELIDELQLKVVSGEEFIDDCFVGSLEINRPGLQLAGFLDYFGRDRIQIVGKVEMEYLSLLTPEDRYARLDSFFTCSFPCMVIARSIEPYPEMIEVSMKYKIPILSSSHSTSSVLSRIIGYLNVQLAPRISMHGGLVEVYGEGVLILGNSGVGKSETTLELIKRGHRMVADDLVEIRKVSDKTLVGSSPEIIRHLMEVRGIGFLDIMHLYGVGSVKSTENINLVIQLELWDNTKDYDRVGLDSQYIDILGINVPSLVIPVKPGRNLAIIVEVAAMNSRQKSMGYNAAKSLNERVFKAKNESVD